MKVLCPRHNDTEPSCEVYATAGWCFAGCGTIPLAELGIQGSVPKPQIVDDINQKLSYIASLPKGDFRGFKLPYDERGYYLVWPDQSFYKLRLHNPTGKNKYLGPRGHKPPLFWVRRSQQQNLMICEGEFDAISAACALPALFDVVSPGSASNFENTAYLTQFLRYRTVVIVTDSDPAGMRGGMVLTGRLSGKGVSLVRVFKSKDQDYNHVLVTFGKDALKEQIIADLQDSLSRKNT